MKFEIEGPLKENLDQKALIYEGAPAHAGKYESEIVTKEAKRVKEALK